MKCIPNGIRPLPATSGNFRPFLKIFENFLNKVPLLLLTSICVILHVPMLPHCKQIRKHVHSDSQGNGCQTQQGDFVQKIFKNFQKWSEVAGSCRKLPEVAGSNLACILTNFLPDYDQFITFIFQRKIGSSASNDVTRISCCASHP